MEKQKRDKTYCCVPQCSTMAGKNPTLSFHRFPIGTDRHQILRRKQWIMKLRIGKPVSHRMRVCSQHFAKEDFFRSSSPGYRLLTKKPRLKCTAVPSQKLPVTPSELKKDPPSKKRRKRPRLELKSIEDNRQSASPEPVSPVKYPVIVSFRSMSSDPFQAALERVKKWQESGEVDIGNEEKLKLYALFKQATEGPCKSTKPSMFDLVGKAKYDAWFSLGKMSKEDAKSQYSSYVNELGGSAATEIKAESKYSGLLYHVGKDVTEITFNRPNKKNAITTQMYTDIISALKEASENDTAVTLLTGAGDYFSSGNDLSNFSAAQGDLEEAAKRAAVLLKEFVAAFIDFPRVLVAAVNGPAVGIPVTLLGLCDVVYAADTATFQTPFSLLGQSPEGCSTYTFPRIMGSSRANEMLLFNRKFSAAEMKEAGVVSEVFPHDAFREKVRERLAFLPDAAKKSLIHSKELIRSREKYLLHQVNASECARLVERWQSPDCMEALIKFFTRKAKL